MQKCDGNHGGYAPCDDPFCWHRFPAVYDRSRDNPKMVRAQKEGKTPFEYLPLGPLEDIARVMATGADRYGRFNWRVDRIKATTYVAAIMRHALIEWAQGSDVDKDSGEHPLAHVAACCLIVLDSIKQGTLIDDRLHVESKSQEPAPPIAETPENYLTNAPASPRQAHCDGTHRGAPCADPECHAYLEAKAALGMIGVVNPVNEAAPDGPAPEVTSVEEAS